MVQSDFPESGRFRLAPGVVSTHSIMPRALTGHDRTAGDGSENSFLGRTIHRQIDELRPQRQLQELGRSSLFNIIVAQDLCTRTGALLVPKGYRVSERLVARLANFNQDLLPTVIRMRKTVT